MIVIVICQSMGFQKNAYQIFPLPIQDELMCEYIEFHFGFRIVIGLTIR